MTRHTLVYEAKWTVLDVENTDPDSLQALMAHLATLDRDGLNDFLTQNLHAEVDGALRPASELSLYIGPVNLSGGTVEIKHLSLEWSSPLDAESYAEEHGEAMYMELNQGDVSVPFMAYEGYQIIEKSDQPT